MILQNTIVFINWEDFLLHYPDVAKNDNSTLTIANALITLVEGHYQVKLAVVFQLLH